MILADEGRGHELETSKLRKYPAIGHEAQSKEANSRIKSANPHHGPDQQSSPSAIAAELQRQPERAGSRHQPEERKRGQVTVDTDAPGNVVTECIRCELPDRMRPFRRRPGYVLDKSPASRHC